LSDATSPPRHEHTWHSYQGLYTDNRGDMYSEGSECVCRIQSGESVESSQRCYEAISEWIHANGARRPPFSVVGRGEAFREMIVIKQHSSIDAYSC
jgi:hypothetical protein